MEIPQSLKSSIARVEKHPGAICIANYKGGVGKTTMTCLMGYYLAKLGKRVLLIDIDAQCSLSLAVGFNLYKIEKPEFTIHDLVLPSNWTKIKKTRFEPYVFPVPDKHAPDSLKIIRGAFDVDELDITIAQEMIRSERSLYELFTYCRQLLYSFVDDFDYILVDCPPNKMYLTQAMLRACSYYVTVTIPDRISVFGVPRLIKWINTIEPEVCPKFLGCILNGVNRAGGYEKGTKNQQLAETTLNDSVKDLMFDYEKLVIGTSPVLAHVPKLDVISRFLSEEGEKLARFDFSKKSSEQKSVDEVMMNLIGRIKTRITAYAKA